LLNNDIREFAFTSQFYKQLFIQKEERVMRRKLIFVACVLFFVMAGCAPSAHFGVPNQAIVAPDQFAETEAAIASAERSEGAKYCPEKIARAKELGKNAAEVYWACQTEEAMALLAEARELAKEAKSCRPSPKAEKKVIILAAEPKAEEKVAAIVSEAPVVILAFEDIHFDFDTSTLKQEAQTILKRNIQILRANPEAKVRIAGYTSALGTEAYNQKLSERRANAVREYLIKEGLIERDRLSIIGYGETRPAMYEAAPKEIYSKAAKANMRVLFEIIMK
jgi:outer membrane protein OmpA-like peptidoglycan-associated protein